MSSSLPRFLPALLSAALPLAALHAQTAPQSPTVAFNKARSLYYTPVDKGLESFHCEVNFDWKDFMQKARNQAVSDDDPALKYYRTVQLSVNDDLHGEGSLHWVAAAPPPEGSEDPITKVREGLQQLWSGFFQSWNGYLTGDMVSLDTNSTVEKTPTGYHVAAKAGQGIAEEQYDEKLLLTSVHVSTPSLDSFVEPTFTNTPQGLLVTGLRSRYKQPPSAQPVDVLMKVNYATVTGFQLPSQLQVTVGPAFFDFRLANCTAQTKMNLK